MKIYTKESLLKLKSNIDLVEVLSSYIELAPQGSTYKGCCPFHDEKTPSFIIRKGDSYYHCFGCGAHGDAINFLMNYLQFSFIEAVENLAERFNTHLELQDGDSYVNIDTSRFKEALEYAAQFYHFYILHTPEGHKALDYLYQRGLDLEFIKNFRIGLAPNGGNSFRSMMYKKKISNDNLVGAGLMSKKGDAPARDFFYDRIMFPVCNYSGQVIGFSGRKYHENTYGGKYINTPETLLFKKNQVLFGLNYCRSRIVKERKAIVVEGQIDALRLIYAGFDITVASLGTAFGSDHVNNLKALGVETIYLAMDNDKAGIESSQKAGHLFQKAGIEVYVVDMPEGFDPDMVLEQGGADAFQKLLDAAPAFLDFLYHSISSNYDLSSPAAKTKVVTRITGLIKEYENRIMVHESLQKLAQIARIPLDLVGLKNYPKARYISKSGSVVREDVDGDMILEIDLLRVLFLSEGKHSNVKKIIKKNIKTEDFHNDLSRKLYKYYFDCESREEEFNLLSLAIDLEERAVQDFLNKINSKKINFEKIEDIARLTVQAILNRNWKVNLQTINDKIKQENCSEDEMLELIRQFDYIKSNCPKVL